jgi:type IV pilus assembly protein PilA
MRPLIRTHLNRSNSQMKKIQKGFTLIELMIVVAIIGILAAIAIPAYQDYIIRSQVSEGLAMASSVKTSVAEFRADRGTWPGNLAALGIATAPSGKYVSGITVTDGEILITFGNDANAALRPGGTGLTLRLRPAVSPNSDILWQCGDRALTTTASFASSGNTANGGTLTGKYRPSNCRA